MLLQSNKLTLTEEDITLTNLRPGDRCDIEYLPTDGGTKPVLIMRTALYTDGKVLTKSHTFSFRGEQNTLLKAWGSNFDLTPITTDMYQLQARDVINN